MATGELAFVLNVNAPIHRLAVQAMLDVFDGKTPRTLTLALAVSPIRNNKDNSIETRSPMMADAAQLNAQQNVDVTISSTTDAHGNPATLDGVPAWESSDPEVVTVTSAPDGMSANIRSGDATGTATVTATAAEGAGTVVGVLSVIVAEGDVTVIDFSVGTPVDNAPA
jgi:hypothetical protein